MNEKEIDLKELFSSLKKHWIIILAITLICAIIGFLFTKFFIAPKYKAEARAIVDVGSSSPSITVEGNSINVGSMKTSQEFVNLFSIILKSSSVLDPIVDELKSQNYNFTYESLKRIVIVSSVNDTQAVEISITHTDKELALKILQMIINKAPKVIEEVLPAGSLKVIDSPRYANSGNHISPNIKKNTTICGLIGFVLIVAIFVIIELFNTTIRGEEDIEKHFGIPVIGKIPRVESKEVRKYAR